MMKGWSLMASNMSTYLADKLLDHSVGDVAYAKPTCYLALFTTAPTMPAGTGGTEVSGGSYSRAALAGLWSAAASESKTNNSTVTFTTATASWGTVTSVGIYDASSAGNLLWAGNLTASQAVGSGVTFSMPASDLTVALS